jgi:hypothetical protein
MRRLFAAVLMCAGFLAAQNESAPSQPAATVETAPATASLVGIRKIYVDALTGDNSAEAIRQLIIASLQQSRLFVITDNPDRADVTLKGAANDTVFTDTFDSTEGLNAHTNSGNYASKSTASHGQGYGSSGVGENESHHIRERKHEAFASVRLCNRDGDVLWATTQESRGAKFKGAGADVADKVMRQLQLDLGKAVRERSQPAVTP